QIRLEFREPLVPLESLESPSEAAKLAYFSIDPALPGRFRLLTPHLVGFQADQALPVATRIRVTVKSGLTDLSGHRLPTDFVWTFETGPLAITSHVPDDPVALTPTLEFSSNAELDADSTSAHVTLKQVHGGGTVPIKVALEQDQTP